MVRDSLDGAGPIGFDRHVQRVAVLQHEAGRRKHPPPQASEIGHSCFRRALQIGDAAPEPGRVEVDADDRDSGVVFDPVEVRPQRDEMPENLLDRPFDR